MTVKQLITELRKFPPSLQVAASSDSEGNTISPLYVVSGEMMRKDGYLLEYSEDDTAKEYVVLWPTA